MTGDDIRRLMRRELDPATIAASGRNERIALAALERMRALGVLRERGVVA